MNTTRYYYSNAEQQPVGPLGRRELDALIQAGVLLPESPILVEGATEWSTVSKLSATTAPAEVWTPPAPPKVTPAQTETEFTWWMGVIAVILLLVGIACFVLFWPYSLVIGVIVAFGKIGSYLMRPAKRR